MKTFEDLRFTMHRCGVGVHARLNFENGYGVSVVLGNRFFSNGFDTYELAVLKNNELCYDTHLTNDVIRYITEEKITEIMLEVQKLK